MTRSVRLLVLSNDPLDAVWNEVKCGDKPDHHLYGINHLAQMGYDIRVVDGNTVHLTTDWRAGCKGFVTPCRSAHWRVRPLFGRTCRKTTRDPRTVR